MTNWLIVYPVLTVYEILNIWICFHPETSPTIPDIEPARCQAELREREMNMGYEVNIIWIGLNEKVK